VNGLAAGKANASAALGGTLGAVLGALAFPILFNVGGPPVNSEFWALSGLLSGGFLGILLGAFLGRSRSGQSR
jgi:hypothetical protein